MEVFSKLQEEFFLGLALRGLKAYRKSLILGLMGLLYVKVMTQHLKFIKQETGPQKWDTGLGTHKLETGT